MRSIKISVLMFEAFKLGLLVSILIGIFTGRINPILAGKIIGIAALLYGAYSLHRAFYQKDHSNVLLRLQGDNRRIPTTRSHRAMNVVLATGMVACGLALLLLFFRW